MNINDTSPGNLSDSGQFFEVGGTRGGDMLAGVDVFGAITETRPDGAARTDAKAVAGIKRCAGNQVDPRVVAAFRPAIEEQVGEIND